MKLCRNCGFNNDDSSTFCLNCGSQIEAQQKTTNTNMPMGNLSNNGMPYNTMYPQPAQKNTNAIIIAIICAVIFLVVVCVGFVRYKTLNDKANTYLQNGAYVSSSECFYSSPDKSNNTYQSYEKSHVADVYDVKVNYISGNIWIQVQAYDNDLSESNVYWVLKEE